METGDTSLVSDEVACLSRLLNRALRSLGETGDTEVACRIAADAWAVLHVDRPREARWFEVTLHRLTRQRRPTPEQVRRYA